MSLFNIEEKITLKTWDDIIHRPRYESLTKSQKYLYGKEDEFKIIGVHTFDTYEDYLKTYKNLH